MDQIDFGELRNDEDFRTKVSTLSEAITKIEKSLKDACAFRDYDDLTIEDKVKYDLFISYSINSLYWMYCKLEGVDTNNHGIKNELSRIRQAMIRDKQIFEHKTKRPVLDKAAAGRFVKHGLNDVKNKEAKDKMPKNRKRKFDDDE